MYSKRDNTTLNKICKSIVWGDRPNGYCRKWERTKIIKNKKEHKWRLWKAREDMAGCNTKDHELQCNLMSKTRFGVMAWNDCSTDKLNVKGNTVDESVLGWAFRHLVNEGSFGQVGDAGNENNNTFTGPQPSVKCLSFVIVNI